MIRAALLQLNASDDPVANLAVTRSYVEEAAAGGANFILTPEVSNCVSGSRTHQNTVLQTESEDHTLSALRADAARLNIWILIGSLALKTGDEDGRFANRSFLIGPDGRVVAKYDKIHMFDVQVTPEETYRESDGFRPGDSLSVADTGFARVGMSVCYDVRFPYLYRALADADATILTVPAAFSPVTGAAHWEPLLRARAIENCCFVLAPAQTGQHAASHGKSRRTHGHSLAIAPWGEVLLDAGDTPGVHFVDLDMTAVEQARAKVPSLTHTRPVGPPVLYD